MPYSMRRNLDEWMELILECRKSGMSDRQWCIANGINQNTFNSAIKHLKHKNYTIPKARDIDIHDFTISKQDVVKVDIIPDIQPPREVIPIPEVTPHLDNSHMIEISIGDIHISLSNGADPVLVSKTLSILRSFS